MHNDMLQLDDFYKARYVLSTVLRKTELVHAKTINPEVDVYLKPECLQKTGSFKLRGAYFKISRLSDEEKAKGVVACSAGNHAQGVALGATAMGVKSLICLPPSVRLRPHGSSVPRLCWCPACMTTPIRRPYSCAMSGDIPSFTRSMTRMSSSVKAPSGSNSLSSCPILMPLSCQWAAVD